MDIDNFVGMQKEKVNKFQRLYKILDLAAVFFTLFSVLWILNIDKWILTNRFFELYSNISYDLILLDISIGSIIIMLFSLFVATIFMILFHRKDENVIIIKLLEKKYPELDERLSTLFDNKSEDNIILNDLKNNVLDITSKIGQFVLERKDPNSEQVIKSSKKNDAIASRYSRFLTKKRLKVNIVLLILTFSLFSVVTITDYRSDITPEEINEIINEIPFVGGQDEELSPDEQFPLDDENGNDAGGGEGLIGEAEIIVVEGEEVDLSLPPGSGTGFTDSGDSDQLPPEFESSSAYEVGKLSSPAYYEELPEGYENLIKEYFEEMAKN